jgi:PAS domain S-box-containing protein
MAIDPPAENLRLRSALRDLVAFSAIPAAWVGREPPAIAAGLADVLVGSLHLDFAFVRLCDPNGGAAVEVTRGDAWQAFPAWRQYHLAVVGQLSRKEIIPDVGAGVQPCRGVVIPIGVNAEGGLVAVACDRPDFPTEIDQLLLSVAANHAATAFQSARLIHERKRAEAELRQARNELEMKVAERTAELRRSEAYLAEAQRLSHTGSWAWNVATRALVHWSQELYRMHGVDPEGGIPPFEAVIQRIHPEDRARALESIERAVRERTEFEVDFRAVLPNGTMNHLHGVAHPVFDAAGEVVEFVGTAMDVTERQRADEERLAHLWFLESMDRINRAMQGTNDLEQMMGEVLDAVLSIFDCDRAWVSYPCDPDTASWRVVMERTRPEFPGASALGGQDLPMTQQAAEVFRALRAADGPVRWGPVGHTVPGPTARRFRVQSQIAMALYPKVDRPYTFGLHQCSSPRVWTPQEERLFQEIGRRLEDALTTLLMFRHLQDSEARLEEAQRLAHVGYWDRDLDTDRLTWSDETYRIFGLPPQARPIDVAGLQELIHPEDRHILVRAAAAALGGGARYDVEYRVVRPGGDVRIVHSQGHVVRDESGRPRRMVGTVQDITERRRAEAELRESERRYRNIFETAGVSIWEEDFSRVKAALDALKAQGVRDFRGYLAAHPEFVRHAISLVKIVDVNAATVKLFGARSKEELLVSLHRIFLPDTEAVFAEELIAIAEGRTSFEAEMTLRMLQGDNVTVLLTIAFPPEPAQLAGVLVSIMDVTDRKRASEALREAQTELAHVTRVLTLGEITASIAHEVNQPLAGVTTNGNAGLRWLARDPPNLEEARECLQRIIRDGNRASEVIARVRALAKKSAPAKARLDLRDTIHEVLAVIDPEVRQHRVAVRTELAAGLPPVWGDRVQVQQVLLNLVMNGIEAMKAVTDRPRVLRIQAQPHEAGHMLVAVQDTGIGLDPQSLARLFEPFYTTKPAGMGMGLSISRSIVEAHGGRLWATPNVGPGVTMQFTLPIGDAGAS